MESVVFQGSHPTYSVVVMLIWNKSGEFWGAGKLQATSFHNTLILYLLWISLRCHLCLQNTSSKRESLQISRWPAAHEAKHRPFWVWVPARLHGLKTHEPGPEFPWTLSMLLHSVYSSFLTFCYITPFSPLLSWSHRNRALSPIICLMFKLGPWISFCILSRPQSPHSITNPYQLSCGTISWILTLPISTAATWYSLQPLQWLPNGFPCSDLSLLMESPDSSQSELSKNKISSGYIPA